MKPEGTYASIGSPTKTTTKITVTVTGLALTGTAAKDYTLGNVTTVSANIGTILP